MNIQILSDATCTYFGSIDEIDVKTTVTSTNMTQRYRFFWIRFSDFVKSKRGTVIHTTIPSMSEVLKFSLKARILIAVTIMGQKVLYRGKNMTESILLILSTLE
jgi:hypothetical protein